MEIKTKRTEGQADADLIVGLLFLAVGAVLLLLSAHGVDFVMAGGISAVPIVIFVISLVGGVAGLAAVAVSIYGALGGFR